MRGNRRSPQLKQARPSQLTAGSGRGYTLPDVAEPGGDHGVRRGRARRMTRDRGQEVVAREGVEPCVGHRLHGGGARHLPEERDLAEVVAGPERCRAPAGDRHLELALGKLGKPVAGLARPHDQLSRGDQYRLEVAARTLQNWPGQRSEQRLRPKELQLGSRRSGGSVKRAEA
jgi:hypothetical protein